MEAITEADRALLFERYKPLSARVARIARRSLPRSIERLEVETIALAGLWSACRRTNTVGVGFSSFAERRIRGAIQDFLRGQDYATRYSRAAARKTGVAAVRVVCFAPDEIADLLVQAPEAPVVVTGLEDALAILGAREREIIQRFDFGDERLHEIGKSLGISEPRACQIRKRALATMRDSGLLNRDDLIL